ncbi:molybdopterin cofactor-binding domain-containing protein [Aquabacterium sp.]|uniref:molybdopterin cofactor-binding domain-containing protein n=1 Tax=Aquabacterium sp. TaxID=1872578 RepID=UPI003784ED03
MTRRADTPRRRADFHAAEGVLLVTRQPPAPPPPAPGQPAIVPGNPAEGPEILLAVWDDGSATALAGHVDLGTGLQTALAQLVAEELDLPLDRIAMQLGHTASVPNQGPTIASASIQIHAAPLRQAAAQARAWLLAQAAARWQRPPADLQVDAGQIRCRTDSALGIGYAELLQGRHLELTLDPATPLKPAARHQLIGQSVPRIDIPAKASGELSFVHDMRLPGLLHGRVIRPPYAGLDAGDFVGTSLEAVDEQSIAHLPGIVATVVIGDFVGVVAEREDQAEAAMHALAVRWKPGTPQLPPLDELATTLRKRAATERLLVDEGKVDEALARAAQRLQREYVWPYQLHASIGPSCAVAHWHAPDAPEAASPAPVLLDVWAGTQNPHVLRADLARLTGLQDVQVNVVRMEAAGCYGRNGADDVAADAALLARAVGRPVRVQLTREQEHLWEPKGAAQLMQVDGGIDAHGNPLAYHFRTAYPSNGAPTLALLLTRTLPATSDAYQMGDRTARPPYGYETQRIVARDMPPILRASWLRGVSALPNSFAHESYIDELAHAAQADPVAYRLKYLTDERARELLQATAARAGWLPHIRPQQQGRQGDWLQGQGVAYARYIHSKWPGFGAAWAAWVADVEVHQTTGEVNVKRVVVGHDAGMMVNPAGITHQVHGNVLQTTSRALKERLPTDPATQLPTAREWGAYPILNFREVPVVDVLLMPRPGEPPLGAGESSSVPGTAAIANAIFDATGVRLRQPPFTPEVLRAAMHPLPAPVATTGTTGVPAASAAPVAPPPGSSSAALPATARLPRRRPWLARGLALVGGLLAAAAGLLGWRPAIAPVAASSGGLYATEVVERGRVLAALGNCAVCHTAEGGQRNAGGRWIETPFGRIASTNLTPDPDTGLGRWSFSAFQRAMREGIGRDGRHLFPAFPYTAFAKTTDDDLQALYAYLMSQPAVRQATPAPALQFPFSLRPLMALWNPLFHDPAPYVPDPAQTAPWNRGAYLVNGLGHCSACHTERNALGAERSGRSHFLAGAVVDGWEAPALTAASPAPIPWTEQSLFDYLRRGYSREHGVATGPMAPVIQDLAALPDEDIRAMAHYLASFQQPAGPDTPSVASVLARARASRPLPSEGQRLFEQACGACHHDGDGPQTLGLNIPLVLSTKVHSARADNLERIIREGIQNPVHRDVGFMGGFGRALDDAQVRLLAAYLRQSVR